ncbi:MAG: penicillin-binding transpeptidase domain-containing protein, partial [Lentisphaeraceae bacterium]|nr:penicillin-binding transpeptidase domain-containing protein [Lentisphaeraceae bacterium]
RAAGGITRTSEYMRDVLHTLAKIFKLESHITSDEIAGMLKSKSTEKIVLMETMTDKQLRILEGRVLPPFIVRDGLKLYLDYSKVELLDRLNSIDRTTENICREIDKICSLIGRPMKDNRDEVKRHIYQRPALPYKALNDLNVRELALISEMLPPLNGTAIVPNAQRNYPYPFEYSHLLGSTRLRDPAKETEEERDHFHYFLPSLEGISGMERYVNDELTGVAGRNVVQVNIAGFVQEFDSGKHSVIKDNELDKFNYDSINGNNVILSIDHGAQKLAYELLINMPRETLGVPLQDGQKPRAAFVLMECDTGAIKAMVSTPSFDMVRFTTGDPEYFNEIYGVIDPENRQKRIHPEKKIPFQLRQEPLINRALSAYEPGSIVKPLIALATLKNDVFEKDFTMQCEGFYVLPTGKKIRCAAKYGHGELNLEGAIEQSCNKFFITAGVELGEKKIRDILAPAGIGRYALSTNDSKRFSQESRGKLFEKDNNDKIYMADIAYSSIGQGAITISPLQAAVFVSAIANGGQVLQPYFIQEIRDSNSEVILESRAEKRVIDKLPVSSEYIEQVQQAMRKVVVGEYASATKARALIEGSIELAGKTGTAEGVYVPKDEEGNSIKDAEGKNILKKIKNTWFTAIAPYDKPKYVAVCFVQGGIYGGTTCAPIVRKFFDNWEKTKPKKKSE